MKLLAFAVCIYFLGSTGCSNSAAVGMSPVTLTGNESQTAEDTSTVIDLNSGERIRIHIDPKNDITTNQQTGEIVKIYVVPATRDTFDGLNGRVVNHAIMKTSLGTYGIDMTKLKWDDKPYPAKKDVAKGL